MMRKRVFIRGQRQDVPNYAAALEACGLEPVVSLDLAEAAACDGLLLSGGADVDPSHYGQENTASVGIDAQRDADEFALIDRFLAMEKPILGICRGHQILNVALGGTLIQNLPDCSHRRTAEQNTDPVHPVRVVHPFLEELYGKHFVSNSSHHQAVDALGKGLAVTCISEDGVVEGFLHENGRILGVQFHPERMAFALRRPDAADGAAIFQAFCRML